MTFRDWLRSLPCMWREVGTRKFLRWIWRWFSDWLLAWWRYRAKPPWSVGIIVHPRHLTEADWDAICRYAEEHMAEWEDDIRRFHERDNDLQ